MSSVHDESANVDVPRLVSAYRELEASTGKTPVAPPIQWGVLPTLAWILSRDLWLVGAVHTDLEIEGEIGMGGSAANVLWETDLPNAAQFYGSDWRAVVPDFLEAIASGAIEVTGQIDGMPTRSIVPAAAFSNPAILFDDEGLHLAEGVRSVRLSRRSVVAMWPATGCPTKATPDNQYGSPRAGRGRRRGVGGHVQTDTPLVEAMRVAVLKDGSSPWSEAQKVAPQAKGSQQPEVREKRLVDLYYKKYPPEDAI